VQIINKLNAHVMRCCYLHECRYNGSCPVSRGEVAQEGMCEQCVLEFDANWTWAVYVNELIDRVRDAVLREGMEFYEERAAVPGRHPTDRTLDLVVSNAFALRRKK
jgi:hypothetical protein